MSFATLEHPEKLADNIYLIDQFPTREELRLWSEGKPGLWIMSDVSISHSVGPRATRYLHRSAALEQIQNAQRVQALTGTDPGPSYASQSRSILKWLDWRGPWNDLHRARFATMITPYHFQHCQAWARIPHIALYDLRASYWQMIKRMPSPLVEPFPSGRVVWHRISDDEKRRKWARLVEFIDESPKLFRLVFVGVCVAGCQSASWQSYHDGRLIDVPMYKIGALAGMAALAIRTTYEVTQMQAEGLGSRYANADCVTAEEERKPSTWERLGLEYSCKAEGPGDIRAIGFYRIGTYETDSYRLMPGGEGGRWYKNATGVSLPTVFHQYLTSGKKNVKDCAKIG